VLEAVVVKVEIVLVILLLSVDVLDVLVMIVVGIEAVRLVLDEVVVGVTVVSGGATDVLDVLVMMVVGIEAVLLVLDEVVGVVMVSGDGPIVVSGGATESLAEAGAAPIIGMFKVLSDGGGGHGAGGGAGAGGTPGAGISLVGICKAALHSEIISAREAANGGLSVAKQLMQVVISPPVKQGHSPAL